MTVGYLPCLPNGALCSGCRWWMPNMSGGCGHDLWKELTAKRGKFLPPQCPIGIALKGGMASALFPFFGSGNSWENNRSDDAADAVSMANLGIPDAFASAIISSSRKNPVAFQPYIPLQVTHTRVDETGEFKMSGFGESSPLRAANKAKAEFTETLQKLMADEAEAVTVLERLARLRRELVAKIEEMLNAPDQGPFSMWDDGRKDTLREVLEILDGKLKKMTGLETDVSR